MAFLTDSSGTPKTVTAVGTAAETTADSRFGGGSLILGATAASYLSVPDSADWDFGTGRYTGEAWVMWPTTVPTTSERQTILAQWATSNLSWWLGWGTGSAGGLTFNYSTGGSLNSGTFNGSWTPVVGQWYHVAFDRDGTNFRLYVDGVVVNSTTVFATTQFFNSTAALTIGGDPTASTRKFTGYIDEVRLSKAVARYAGAFTPPTTPFTSDANTVLLLHLETSSTGTATAKSRQLVAEVVGQPVPKAQSSQVVAEVVTFPTAMKARSSQLVAEVVTDANAPLKLSQTVVEVAVLPANPNLLLSQLVVEVIRQNGTETVYDESAVRISVPKLNAYAITGGAPNKVTAAKLTAYAIVGGARNAATVSKLTVYAIVSTAVITARPQVFVCT